MFIGAVRDARRRDGWDQGMEVGWRDTLGTCDKHQRTGRCLEGGTLFSSPAKDKYTYSPHPREFPNTNAKSMKKTPPFFLYGRGTLIVSEMAVYTCMYRPQRMGKGGQVSRTPPSTQNHPLTCRSIVSGRLSPLLLDGLEIHFNEKIYTASSNCLPSNNRPKVLLPLAVPLIRLPGDSVLPRRPPLRLHVADSAYTPRKEQGLKGPTGPARCRIDAFADKNAGSVPGYSSNSARSSPARVGRLLTWAIPALPQLSTDPLRTFRPCRCGFCHHCT